MAASNPNAANSNHILKAREKTLTAETYKKNVYYIKNIDNKYVKACDNYSQN
jgi:hypothetical protein